MAGLFYIHNGSIRALAFKVHGALATVEPGETKVLRLATVPGPDVVQALRSSGVVFRHAEPGEEPAAPPAPAVDDTGASDNTVAGSVDNDTVEGGGDTQPPAPTGEERANAIAEAVELLQDDISAWTTAGTPRVNNVEKLVGFDISSDEVAGFTRKAAD